MNQTKSSDEASQGWVNFGPPWLRVVLTILLIPPMFIYSMIMMAYFIVILVPWALFKGYRENRTFRRQLRANGRTIDFAEIVVPLQAGRGVVLFCAVPKGLIGPLWWLPDSGPESVVASLPTLRRFLATVTPENFRLLHEALPTIRTCWDRYLDPQRGSAKLIVNEPPQAWSVLESAPEHSVYVTYAFPPSTDEHHAA